MVVLIPPLSSPLLDICSFSAHRWRRGGSHHMHLPSSPSLSPALHTRFFIFFPLGLLTVWTFIPSHSCTIPHTNLWLLLSASFLSIPPVFRHFIDLVFTSVRLHSFTLFFFLSCCCLYLSVPSSVSLPAGCFRAVCRLMFLWEVIKAWITDRKCVRRCVRVPAWVNFITVVFRLANPKPPLPSHTHSSKGFSGVTPSNHT